MIVNDKISNREDVIDTNNKKHSSILRLNGATFELGRDTLIVRKNGSSFKEKITVDIDSIMIAKVRIVSHIGLLVASIILLSLGVAAFFPLYQFYGSIAFSSIGAGFLLFIIFLSIYCLTKNVYVTITLKNGMSIRKMSKVKKTFEYANDFVDELYYRKNNR